MLRRPYGAKTEPIDSFPFEEIPGTPEHETYVWGNAALAGALVLAGAFEQGGWDLHPETAAEIQGRRLWPQRRGRPNSSASRA